MSLVLGDFGMLNPLYDIIHNSFNGLTLHLYQNAATLGPAMTGLDFTECDFDGYASGTLASWGFPSPSGLGGFESVHPDVVFTCTGSVTPNDVYGWYVTDGTGAVIAAEARASGPVTVTGSGATYTVTPVLRLTQL